ncbi:HEAT repeat domain-containing protein [Aquabacter spiritensis]|uniref:HEAT repeat protein n=1 Tax=Aquabacter spiritensis TaxID=933073 RepID=A0A4R3LTQ4_9HYPH|nr:HEAT repeat domain-containing protein [Aquabacter spiritensis]TCT01727.1 HEAT repeat protein [Aquabacter spiritensis]
MPLIRRPSPAAPDPAAPAPAFTGGTAEERWAAARAAAGSAEAVPTLAAALATEPDMRVREAIFTSLALIDTDASVQAVLAHVRSDDAGMRTAALDALRAMPRRAGRHLPALLRDPDADVRILACDLCRSVAPPELHALLGPLLETEPEANVCAAAVEVLADGGGPDILPALSRCAARFGGDPFLAFSIRIAAARIAAQRCG